YPIKNPAISRGGGILTIVDYKNGRWDVPVMESDGTPNPQIATYAAGELVRLGWPVSIEWVRLVVIQPNSLFGTNVKQQVLPVYLIKEFVGKIEAAVAAIPTAEPNPGNHCRYCPAFGRCSATQGVL